MPSKMRTFSLPSINPNMTKAELMQTYQNMAAAVDRSALISGLGQTFGGARDVYEIFGWKRVLRFDDYLQMYDRNGLAARVVDALADESWRLPPEMKDGDVQSADEDEGKLTDYLRAWNEVTEKLDVWAKFNELDTALGISRYAVILLGAPGNFETPLERASALSYLQVYDEGQATISTTDRDANSSRYGMPLLYQITFEDGSKSRAVHHSRVVHCKEGRGRSRVYGIPRLKKSYNYLQDLEKVVGSSSEAFWLLIRKGLIISARDGAQLPAKGTEAYNDMQDEISEWEHQLRRVMRLKNMDVTDMGAQVVDGRGQHDLLITDIAGTNGMPQRVLVGSERGELASTSDDSNWASVVSARQKNECEKWVKDFAKTLVTLGVLPAPTGKTSIQWQELYKLTKEVRTTVAAQAAQTISTITGGAPETAVDIADFMKEHFNYVLPANANANLPKPITPPEGKEGGEVPPLNTGAGLKGEQDTQLIQDAVE